MLSGKNAEARNNAEGEAEAVVRESGGPAEDGREAEVAQVDDLAAEAAAAASGPTMKLKWTAKKFLNGSPKKPADRSSKFRKKNRLQKSSPPSPKSCVPNTAWATYQARKAPAWAITTSNSKPKTKG